MEGFVSKCKVSPLTPYYISSSSLTTTTTATMNITIIEYSVHTSAVMVMVLEVDVVVATMLQWWVQTAANKPCCIVPSSSARKDTHYVGRAPNWLARCRNTH